MCYNTTNLERGVQLRDTILFVVACVVVIGALSYMEKHLGKHGTNHGAEVTKVVPAKTGYEHAIWKI